jgi:hypothetical protein
VVRLVLYKNPNYPDDVPGGASDHFFPASMASPFLHAMILMRCALTMSLDSILNVGFLMMKVHTSSHRRYVRRWP